MDLITLSSYYNDSSLTSNYYPIYIRSDGTEITSLLQPSFDILKYKFIDETTIYTENDIMYLDKVSYEQYNDYTQTRNLYIVNSLIKDPIKTYQYSNYVLVDKNKIVDTISKGILFTNKKINYAFPSFNISYLYDSLLTTSSDIQKKIKTIDEIVIRIMNKFSSLTAEDEEKGVRYCYSSLLDQFLDSNSEGWYQIRTYKSV